MGSEMCIRDSFSTVLSIILFSIENISVSFELQTYVNNPCILFSISWPYEGKRSVHLLIRLSQNVKQYVHKFRNLDNQDSIQYSFKEIVYPSTCMHSAIIFTLSIILYNRTCTCTRIVHTIR